jgi:hypothetical protein
MDCTSVIVTSTLVRRADYESRGQKFGTLRAPVISMTYDFYTVRTAFSELVLKNCDFEIDHLQAAAPNPWQTSPSQGHIPIPSGQRKASYELRERARSSTNVAVAIVDLGEEGSAMTTIPVNQSVDVHSCVPAERKLDGSTACVEHIRKFHCLIAAARLPLRSRTPRNRQPQIKLSSTLSNQSRVNVLLVL